MSVDVSQSVSRSETETITVVVFGLQRMATELVFHLNTQRQHWILTGLTVLGERKRRLITRYYSSAAATMSEASLPSSSATASKVGQQHVHLYAEY